MQQSSLNGVTGVTSAFVVTSLTKTTYRRDHELAVNSCSSIELTTCGDYFAAL